MNKALSYTVKTPRASTTNMQLGQVSWLDIVIFVCFAAFYLLRDVGFWDTLICGIQALPFLGGLPLSAKYMYVQSADSYSVLRLPVDIVRERYLTVEKYQLPFTQRTTLFQDLIVRCMRYAFSNIPSRITKVFFARGVALPFLRFRMLRHGYFRQLRRPVWREIRLVS